MMAGIDLNFIARQQERILVELRSIRDDMRVNAAMMQRCTNAITDLAQTLDAIHQWVISTNERIAKLEVR